MNLPRVAIISTKEGKAQEIAESMGAKHLTDNNNIVEYLWDIDNKYYTSQLLLCATKNFFGRLPKLADDLDYDALIIYYDPQADVVDQELDRLTSLTKYFDTAEVLLFSCGTISDVFIRNKVVNWCLHNKFELVELEQTGDSESDTEGNKCGIERIIEALHSNVWYNIEMKAKPFTEETQEVNGIKEQFENIRLTCDSRNVVCMEEMLGGIMGDENADFGELYGQIATMKEHAASLPMNERRLVAEQLVTAFWKAMGGDHLEIED